MTMRFFLTLAAILVVTPGICGNPPIPIQRNGCFTLDSIRGSILFFGKTWIGRREQNNYNLKPDAGFPVDSKGTFRLCGIFLTDNRRFDFL
jgi:hypothetical protein